MRLFAWQIQGRSATRFYATDLDEFVDFHAWQSVYVRVPDLLVDVFVLKWVLFRSLKDAISTPGGVWLLEQAEAASFGL